MDLLTTTPSVFQERVINHAAGSHGVSGIFVKYDTSSLMVTVSEQHMPLWQFLVRLCGIIGGIFSTTGKSGFSCSLHFCLFNRDSPDKYSHRKVKGSSNVYGAEVNHSHFCVFKFKVKQQGMTCDFSQNMRLRLCIYRCVPLWRHAPRARWLLLWRHLLSLKTRRLSARRGESSPHSPLSLLHPKYRLLALCVLLHCEVDLIDCAESILGCAATQPDEQSKQSPDSAVSWPWPSGVASSQSPVFWPPSNCGFCLLRGLMATWHCFLIPSRSEVMCYLMSFSLWFSTFPRYHVMFFLWKKVKPSVTFKNSQVHIRSLHFRKILYVPCMCCTPTISKKCSLFSFQLH